MELAPNVRAVVAPFIPSAAVALFSGLGIAALKIDAAAAKGLKGSAHDRAARARANGRENEPDRR